MSLHAAWHRYWFEMPAPAARMVLLRVVFFGILGFDLWLMMIPHAPRYGAGGFNVPHVEALADVVPLPSTPLVTALWLLGGFLALRAAAGVAVRASIVGLTAIYLGVYLWSQVDSYQHHYFIGLLLVILCFVPESAWHPAPPGARQPPTAWALRLLYVQVALVYFWTGVTKLTPAWLDGGTLDVLVAPGSVRDGLAAIAGWFDLSLRALLAGGAWAVALVEVAAAVVLVTRRAMPAMLLLLPAFHVGVEVLGFRIEWFSYYMLALDAVLLVPDRWIARLDPLVRAAGARVEAFRDRLAAPRSPAGAMIQALAAAAGAAALAAAVPLEGTTELAVLLFFAVLAAQWPWSAPAIRRAPARTAAHLGLALALFTLMRWTAVPYDYYRLWAGDLRRRGELEEAARRYEQANARAGDGPGRYLALGRLYERLGRPERARAAYEQAVRRYEVALRGDAARAGRESAAPEPLVERGWRHIRLAESLERLARLLEADGRDTAGDLERQAAAHRDDAETAFRAGLERDPSNARAWRGLSRLRSRPEARADDDAGT